MSTAKIKKKIRRLQKGLLKRHNPRRDASTRSTTPRNTQSAADSEIASPTRSPATLTRSQGRRNQSPERSQARQARVDASANPNSPPKISKPAALKQQSTSQEPNNTNGKQASKGKPKRDFATGRTLFPVESGSKTQYLPITREATSRERRLGLFVANDSVQKDAVNTLLDPATVEPASVRDFNTGRTLFATETADGKREYLPKESEATALELSQSKYLPDAQVEAPPIGNEVLNKRPLFEFNGQRNLFATKATDGSIEYLPKKSDATAFELSQGRYINDGEISLKAPLGAENAMSKRKPRYDIGKGRIIYGKGKIEYLPLLEDASNSERIFGLYAAFVPLEPLQDFLANVEDQNQIARQSFATERGEVITYSQEDIDAAFEQAPTLVLRSAKLVIDSDRQTPNPKGVANNSKA